MPKFKVPERDDSYGTKVADLLDQLVALTILEVGDVMETRHGERPFVKVTASKIDLEASTLEDVGEVLVFQEVLVRKLSRYESGEVVVGRIVQPGAAYLFDPPDDDELGQIEKLLEPDSEEPF